LNLSQSSNKAEGHIVLVWLIVVCLIFTLVLMKYVNACDLNLHSVTLYHIPLFPQFGPQLKPMLDAEPMFLQYCAATLMSLSFLSSSEAKPWRCIFQVLATQKTKLTDGRGLGKRQRVIAKCEG
jgi:hypothetical protein